MFMISDSDFFLGLVYFIFLRCLKVPLGTALIPTALAWYVSLFPQKESFHCPNAWEPERIPASRFSTLYFFSGGKCSNWIWSAVWWFARLQSSWSGLPNNLVSLGSYILGRNISGKNSLYNRLHALCTGQDVWNSKQNRNKGTRLSEKGGELAWSQSAACRVRSIMCCTLLTTLADFKTIHVGPPQPDAFRKREN